MTEMEIWIVAAATLAGPILAVQAQKFIERATEKKRRKLQVFYTLMATRATRLAAEHVQALNLIELEFGGRGERSRKVIEAWRAYADHLSQIVEQTEAAQRAAGTRRDDLFIELMHALSSALGYKFDRVQLRRGAYYPQGHHEVEMAEHLIRARLVKVLSGEQPLSMDVKSFPASADALELQEKVHQALLKMLADKEPLRVSIDAKSSG